ncbi:hypothetical protein PRZ48_002841 [Zasmidium cellare]|uniref:AB hydrolase-1 domain-containing protein n=1 Tax=Zasmidium cellare TaxID=395010 RepID=A0ABR0EVL4_ZASCE|nr:hypothetical protein PRZ48_002841 [Zasmidium cellare]
MEFEGRAPFAVDGLPPSCETWYKVFGDLKDISKVPLFVLHGGPQAGHEYLLSLRDLHEPIIFYDQVGCGKSTTGLPEQTGDGSWWTSQLHCKELSNLIAHLGLEHRPIDVIGHSWGGMLASEWASDRVRAKNLRRLVLYSSLASIEGHVKGLEETRALLPQDVQSTIERGLKDQDFESPELKDAMDVFLTGYVSLSQPFPCDEVKPAFVNLATSKLHKIVWGPHFLVPSGLIRSWTSIPFLHQIQVPTLMTRGSVEYIPDSAMQPFFDLIPKIKWITFENAAHFSHIEQREKFLTEVRHFLAD